MSRPATPEDVDAICRSLPQVELGISWGDRPTYKVPLGDKGRGFVLYRRPHRTAIDPSTGEMYDDLLVIRTPTEADKLGLVAADPQIYRHFADQALFDFVRVGWLEIVMAAPAVYGLLLMAGEVTAGTLLLVGGRPARAGWAAVIAFHLLLLVFGWGFWLWSVPALAVLVPLARRDRPRTEGFR